MKRETRAAVRRTRKGAIAVMTALLLLAIIGLIALAFDTGWIVMTRTQLQAVADSSSLAGGTELLPGLGLFATKTPAEVATAASAAAVDFAGRNPNAELNSSFVDSGRDIRFGKAIFDNSCGCWSKTEGAEPYNYVEVTSRRDQAGSGGDREVPLFFARIFNYDQIGLVARATAVILPANGFRVDQGSDDTAEVMPFALNREIWEKFLRAQNYYDVGINGYAAHDPAMLAEQSIPDPVTNTPLFFAEDPHGNPLQIMTDNHTVTDGVVSTGADTHLEIMVYDHRGVLSEEDPGGNFGTVDFGGTSNSTSVLKRQIEEGLNAEDLSYYDDNTIDLSENDPLDAEADTGISGGIESALQAVIGKCKAIALFSAVSDGSGNTTDYTLVEFVAVTVVEADLSTGNKRVVVQRCTLVDDNAIPDYDEEIGPDTTIFTPLILIE